MPMQKQKTKTAQQAVGKHDQIVTLATAREQAERSQIKQKPYSEETVLDLLRAFRKQIIEVLLFLRSVERIEVYINSESAQAPPGRSGERRSRAVSGRPGPRRSRTPVSPNDVRPRQASAQSRVRSEWSGE